MFFLLIRVIANAPFRQDHFYQAGDEGLLAVTVRAGGNVQKLRPEISTSVISDLGNWSALEADAVYVGNRHPAALIERAHDFTDGWAASFAAANIVDREVGGGGVETAVGDGP
jgi:hypothetical protein